MVFLHMTPRLRVASQQLSDTLELMTYFLSPPTKGLVTIEACKQTEVRLPHPKLLYERITCLGHEKLRSVPLRYTCLAGCSLLLVVGMD